MFLLPPSIVFAIKLMKFSLTKKKKNCKDQVVDASIEDMFPAAVRRMLQAERSEVVKHRQMS